MARTGMGVCGSGDCLARPRVDSQRVDHAVPAQSRRRCGPSRGADVGRVAAQMWAQSRRRCGRVPDHPVVRHVGAALGHQARTRRGRLAFVRQRAHIARLLLRVPDEHLHARLGSPHPASAPRLQGKGSPHCAFCAQWGSPTYRQRVVCPVVRGEERRRDGDAAPAARGAHAAAPEFPHTCDTMHTHTHTRTGTRTRTQTLGTAAAGRRHGPKGRRSACARQPPSLLHGLP